MKLNNYVPDCEIDERRFVGSTGERVRYSALKLEGLQLDPSHPRIYLGREFRLWR